ncbi:MAG TPA: acyl-[ACP]--phospholipid O-acyltransferase [Nitrospira sp.]|nr:acyl-[ACP]--phospholipid O-acyltransferase [Nitrospira sp.]
MTTSAGSETQPLSYPLRGLLIAQFCGAFNDNAWKLMVALLAIRQATAGMASGPALETVAQTQTAVAFVIFTLPLVFLSLVGGTLADRVSKRTVIISIKVIEVFLMAAGTAALWLNPVGGVLPLVVLCGMGVHSALFSPSKYGILPELIPHERLAVGNGLLEMWTFAAILTGTAAGGFLLQMSGDHTWLAPLVLTGLSVIGLATAFHIPQVSSARAVGGVGATLQGAWAAIQSERMLRMAIPMDIMFWTIASLFGQNVLVYAKAVLHLSDAMSGLPLTVLSVGIGIGAMLVGRISRNRVEYGLIPVGAIGVFLTLLSLGILAPPLTGTFLMMGVLGIASSFIFVPLNAILQWKSPSDRRGAVISFSNTCVFTGILLGSLAGGSMANAGLSTTGIFLAAAAMTLGGIGWALWFLPDTFLRFVLVVLTNTLYRLRIVGQSHVPPSGGALLVPNHVSFIDGFLLIASLDRPVRFVVDSQYTEQPIFKPFMKTLGVIPISSHGGLRVILKALRDAGAAVDKGELVCIFPEGQITRTGTLLPFRRGFERVVKGRTAPIIPVHLDRVWGSIFSFNHGRFLWKFPEQLPYPVTVSFGEPLPPGTPTHELHGKIQELGEVAWQLRKPSRQPLHRQFIRSMRRYPFRLAMADQNRPRVSSLQALIGSIVLARMLRSYWKDQQRVGVLLPPTVATALVNVAAPLCGKTIVNLNYTVGKSGLEAAVEQAGLRTIVTSRVFIEKAKLELPDGPSVVWLEDVAAAISKGQKVLAALLALLAPCRFIERACGQMTSLTPDSLATIIFSSGSTGEPKGVMLSHFNIDANSQGATQVLHLYQDERVLGILPFFHSFGYMVFWFVMSNNGAMIFHPSPLDVTAIGELVRQYRITFLVTTPTFMQLYSRRCTPEQFSSVRVILTGAEKLSARLTEAIEDKFGIGPIEGYGVTECSPVIAVNCPDFRAAGYYQPASRRGTVGQPLPGVSVQIVDPDSYMPLSAGTAGILLVKGPNVMNGYLGREDLTVQVMRNGWYITGDIASLDEDGFLTITDRLSRFSKIGGEMVPHGKVEEVLHQAAEADTLVFAVTGLPDEKKGERLAVLHTLEESRIPPILEKISASGLPNLFIPGKHQFIKVDALPVLGTGKLDLRGVKRIAMEHLSSQETSEVRNKEANQQASDE